LKNENSEEGILFRADDNDDFDYVDDGDSNTIIKIKIICCWYSLLKISQTNPLLSAQQNHSCLVKSCEE